MSQYGATGMAKNQYTYVQILQHYYSGINVQYMETVLAVKRLSP